MKKLLLPTLLAALVLLVLNAPASAAPAPPAQPACGTASAFTPAPATELPDFLLAVPVPPATSGALAAPIASVPEPIPAACPMIPPCKFHCIRFGCPFCCTPPS